MPPKTLISWLKRALTAGAYALCLVVCSGVGPASTMEPALRCEIEGVRYLGDGAYALNVKILSWNRVPFTVRSVDNRFSVQALRIGQWITLESERGSTAAFTEVSETMRLAPREITMGTVVYFPKSLDRIYRNATDEINLKLISVVGISSPGEDSTRRVDLEQAYWVTPGTGDWVLREGM